MTTIKFHDPNDGQMRVVGLMSGSGSNLVKIIEFEKQLEKEQGKSPYHLCVIFSDRYNSNATKIGKKFDIPVITRDIAGFYKSKGEPFSNLEVRTDFDFDTVEALEPFEVAVAAYGGYMSIATNHLIDAFIGINVHPADLSVIADDKRKYTGDHAVRDAIVSGEKCIRSSTHIVRPKVDYGQICMISSPHEVQLRPDFDSTNEEHISEAEDNNQDALKKIGDHIIFPKTLQYFAEGRFSHSANTRFNPDHHKLYFDNKEIPNGLKLE